MYFKAFALIYFIVQHNFLYFVQIFNAIYKQTDNDFSDFASSYFLKCLFWLFFSHQTTDENT